MPSKPPSDQSPIAVAMQWATRIMTLVIEMMVPGFGGIWLDNRLGTKVLFTLIGFGLGGTFALWQLLRMTKSPSGRTTNSGSGENREQRGP